MKTYQYWTCKKIPLTTEEYESCKSSEAWIIKIKITNTSLLFREEIKSSSSHCEYNVRYAIIIFHYGSNYDNSFNGKTFFLKTFKKVTLIVYVKIQK